MSEEKAKTLLPMDVIALPPLKMVLVHARNENVNNAASLDSVEFLERKNEEEAVDPESVKKLIQHLEKKKPKE